MGSIARRLNTLEDRDRAQAAAEVRRAWENLSDEGYLLVLAPFYFGREPTPEETAAEEKFREMVPEPLIARAIGHRPDLAEEELSRRMAELLGPVLKRTGVRRRLDGTKGGRAWGA